MKQSIAGLIALVACSVWTADAEARKWTDKSGEFSVEAEFLGYQDGKVKLVLADGRVVEVARSRLSNDDLRFIPQAIKALKEGKEPEVFAGGRIWTSQSGQKVFGRFLGVEADCVRLAVPGGNEITLPQASLVEEDREFVTSEAARLAEVKRQEAERKRKQDAMARDPELR